MDLKQKFESGARDPFAQDHSHKFKGHLGISTKLSKQLKIGARFAYRAQATGRHEEPRDLHIDDAYLNIIYRFQRSSISSLNDAWSFAMNVRGYAPTGEESRFENGRQGSGYLAILGERHLSRRVSFNFVAETQANNLSRGWSVLRGRKVAHEIWAASEVVELKYQAQPWLTLSQFLGYEHSWSASLPNRIPRSHAAILETAIEAELGADSSVYLSYRNTINTHAPQHDFAVYRSDQSAWILELKSVL